MACPETTGPGTWNFAGVSKLGTVGPVLPEIELDVAEDGEVLFRGPNIFQGYFKSPEETAEAIDAEGWFHTGDLGRIDSDGFLTITGRKERVDHHLRRQEHRPHRHRGRAQAQRADRRSGRHRRRPQVLSPRS